MYIATEGKEGGEAVVELHSAAARRPGRRRPRGGDEEEASGGRGGDTPNPKWSYWPGRPAGSCDAINRLREAGLIAVRDLGTEADHRDPDERARDRPHLLRFF